MLVKYTDLNLKCNNNNKKTHMHLIFPLGEEIGGKKNISSVTQVKDDMSQGH